MKSWLAASKVSEAQKLQIVLHSQALADRPVMKHRCSTSMSAMEAQPLSQEVL